MSVNADKPQRWKADIAQSVDCYNDWFINYAPETYRRTRSATTEYVKNAFSLTRNLMDIHAAVLQDNPFILPILRMATAPPIARDRLIGLAGVSSGLIAEMEKNKRIPPRMAAADVDAHLVRIGNLIMRLADKDMLPWLESRINPSDDDVQRAATVVADRLCGALSDPIVRNAQEQRQLAVIRTWLENRGYTYAPGSSGSRLQFDRMAPGTFTFRLNVAVRQIGRSVPVNIPIDVVVMPFESSSPDLPLLIEAKSAGDFTNTNKRRKEEATKVVQLRSTYGDGVRFVLFLCGYFDSGYLGYEAAEGIDWVWEHRIDDLTEFDL